MLGMLVFVLIVATAHFPMNKNDPQADKSPACLIIISKIVILAKSPAISVKISMDRENTYFPLRHFQQKLRCLQRATLVELQDTMKSYGKVEQHPQYPAGVTLVACYYNGCISQRVTFSALQWYPCEQRCPLQSTSH